MATNLILVKDDEILAPKFNNDIKVFVKKLKTSNINLASHNATLETMNAVIGKVPQANQAEINALPAISAYRAAHPIQAKKFDDEQKSLKATLNKVNVAAQASSFVSAELKAAYTQAIIDEDII